MICNVFISKDDNFTLKYVAITFTALQHKSYVTNGPRSRDVFPSENVYHNNEKWTKPFK